MADGTSEGASDPGVSVGNQVTVGDKVMVGSKVGWGVAVGKSDPGIVGASVGVVVDEPAQPDRSHVTPVITSRHSV
jgi:hypothetical protein